MPDLPLESLDQLNAYSRKFASLLFERFPEWRLLTVFDGETKSMLVEIKSPIDENRKLRIYTDEDEITLEYDLWHMHLGWPDVPLEVTILELFEQIDDLLEERAVIEIWMKGKEWKGSQLIEENHTKYSFHSIDADRIYWRSWLGTFDLESIV